MNNMTLNNTAYPKRGDIHWVALDMAVGPQTDKVRPGLIVSNDLGNQYSPIVTVAPITSQAQKIYPCDVQIKLEKTTGKIMLNQCTTLDKSRVKKRITTLDEPGMQSVEKAMKIALGIDQLPYKNVKK